MADVLEFSHRKNLFAKPCTFRIDDKTLSIVVSGITTEQIELSHVDTVRLKYAPLRSQPNRFECSLSLAGHPDLEFSNIFFVGAFDQQEKSAEYVPFVRTLIQRIADANPQTRFVGGMTPVGYYVSTGFFLLILAMFAALLFFVPFGKLSTTNILKIILILLFIPALFRHMRTNKPRDFSPSDPPADLLPTVKS